MKLRIRGNSIRFRLTKSEVEEFGSAGFIEEKLDFGDGAGFRYALETHSHQSLRAVFENGKISVFVPLETARQWTSGNEVGIDGAAGKLKILIEKDFSCLVPQKNDDESDNYPHPDADASC